MTITKTAADIEKHLTLLERDTNSRKDALQEQMIERRSYGYSTADLENQLSTLEHAYNLARTLSRSELTEARQREATQHEEAEQRTQEKENAEKADIFTEWKKSGGDASSFEEAYPEIKAEIIRKRTVEAMLNRDNHSIAIKF